jgi:phage baseplate assembly protein V
MRMQAMAHGNTRADSRMGLVTGYDPNAYAVKVQIMPEGAETGWLPLACPWIGNGWGLFCPPSIGDMIEVEFQEGSPQAGHADMRFYNDSDRPLPCPSGEFWLVHKSGSLLKFHNDGTVELHAATALNSSAPLWTHTGDMMIHGHVTGDGGLAISGGSGASVQVSGSITATGDIVGGGISLDHHTHTDPQGGNTGGPA